MIINLVVCMASVDSIISLRFRLPKFNMPTALPLRFYFWLSSWRLQRMNSTHHSCRVSTRGDEYRRATCCGEHVAKNKPILVSTLCDPSQRVVCEWVLSPQILNARHKNTSGCNCKSYNMTYVIRQLFWWHTDIILGYTECLYGLISSVSQSAIIRNINKLVPSVLFVNHECC